MAGFNSTSSLGNDGGWFDLLTSPSKIAELYVGVKNGLDANSVEKKRLEVQAAEQRTQQAATAASAAVSMTQSMVTIVKIFALGVAGFLIGWGIHKIFKRGR